MEAALIGPFGLGGEGGVDALAAARMRRFRRQDRGALPPRRNKIRRSPQRRPVAVSRRAAANAAHFAADAKIAASRRAAANAVCSQSTCRLEHRVFCSSEFVFRLKNLACSPSV